MGRDDVGRAWCAKGNQHPGGVMIDAPVIASSELTGDEQALIDFFLRVPPEERLFFKDDVTNPAVIRRWAETIDFERMVPLLAFSGGTVVADATLHRTMDE